MHGLFLFIISFILVILSSYYLSSIYKSKRAENTALFFVLTAVSQIIINVELLSLFNKLTPNNIIIVNFIFFVVAKKLHSVFKNPCINFKELFKLKEDILSSFKKDKILLLLATFFSISALIGLFYTIAMPTGSADSMSYHLAWVGFWIQNQTINHYETPNLNQLIFPVNSEIITLWSVIFFKSDYLALFPSYLSYFGTIFVLFSFLSYLKISTRRILWSIFILASLPALILESSSAQTNLIMGFLLLSSFYLFVFGVKENERKSVIFSAVAFCIALGTKNTAIFFIPAFALGYLLIAIKEKKHQFYKPLLLFTGAFIIGFIFLASYNYVSNYLSFGNPIAADIFLDRHSNNISFKAFIANLIRYLTFFIDFTGIKIANELAPHILSARDFLFILFDISPKDGLAVHDNYSINFKIHENLSMFGILGFLLIIPLALKCCFRKISFKNNKSFYISVSALIALGFLLTISALMGFIFWSNRYLTTAVIVCSLILAYSYNKKLNLTKLIITIIAIFNYSVVSTMCVAKPFIEVSKELGNYGYFNFRNEARFRNEANFKEKTFYYINVKALSLIAPDDSKIALVFSSDNFYYPYFEENPTWKLFPVNYKTLVEKNNYNDYDFIVISDLYQMTDAYKKSEVEFNYVLKDKKPVFIDETKPKILYINENAEYITSGKTFASFNLIDLEKMPDNFKLVKKIELNRNTKGSKDPRSRNSYIFKQIY